MFHCPHCGEAVADEAPRCPHCGSDDETGWNPDVEYHSVELPDEFDEGGASAVRRRQEALQRRCLGGIAAVVGLLILASGRILDLWGLLACLLIIGGGRTFLARLPEAGNGRRSREGDDRDENDRDDVPGYF